MAEHDATAIQVHFDDKIVGWLNHYDGSKVKTVRLDITTATESCGGFGEPHIDSRIFTLKRLRRNFSALDQMRMSIEEFAEMVGRACPSYAVETRLHERDAICFEWMALKLDTFEEYEWVFEHHCFVAADAPTDFEALKDARATEAYASEYTAPYGAVSADGKLTLSGDMIVDGSVTASRITGMSADMIITDDVAALPPTSWDILGARRTGKSTAMATYAKKMADLETEKVMYRKQAEADLARRLDELTKEAMYGGGAYDPWKNDWTAALKSTATESVLTADSLSKLASVMKKTGRW